MIFNNKRLGGFAGALAFGADLAASGAEEQHAGGFFFAGGFVGGDGAIEELADFEVDLEEGRALGEFPADQGFR